MSTIFVHCGQAGNEIGGVVWRLAWAEKPPRRWFFDERGTARAVFVDTEPKVVRGVVRSLGPERVHPRCALVEQSGRGNNWAMGYGGVDGGGRNGIADAALEALRWQWERCDWCTGVVLSHSIGGGTGSGLGSLLLQELRDEHPRHYLTAAAMCPFAAGELPLGHYNATLALSFLQEFADAIILFDNTQLLRHLTSSAAVQSHAASHSSQQPARLDMKHLDAYVGSGLAGLTFPTDGPLGRRPFDAADLVIGRGVAGEPPDERIKHRLLQLLGGSPCSPFPVDYKLSASPATALPSQNALRSLTLVSNRSSAGPQLEQILIRARLQLLGKAYVHHFERHGVSTEFIAERAEYMQTIVDEYEGCRAAFAGSQPPVVSPVRAAGAAASLSPRGTLPSPGNPAAPLTPSNIAGAAQGFALR
ncbi:cryptic tubulin [Chrysochromulina tobinii]|uniref:Cryptic tubulin n=1 Tax=Chrysochromulina tobinii TaxID=1460289 RepID=A0A0M0KBU0_9EUKA|nr:cryptic tubulin [Chrysochromulina tobinii]|eukprot:KOO36032.1 cryptic tubulin [Chrysochromulina sp. CCMP291]